MAKRKKSSRERAEAAERRRARRGTTGAVDPSVDGRPLNTKDDVVRTVFFGEGQEPITQALADELVAAGEWTPKMAKEALEMAEEGFTYNRIRHSLVGPTEFEAF
jgi:hypothetical protein